ncbi:hypothetical protein LCGC14_2321320, partial [marine sediment metagenome]
MFVVTAVPRKAFRGLSGSVIRQGRPLFDSTSPRRPPSTQPPDRLGRARRLEDAEGRYIEFAKNTFPKGLRLDGLKVVVDCAHGATYK